jgi:hypothetical protein
MICRAMQRNSHESTAAASNPLGRDGQIVWEKNKTPTDERYDGPSMNLASVADFNGDGKEMAPG